MEQNEPSLRADLPKEGRPPSRPVVGVPPSARFVTPPPATFGALLLGGVLLVALAVTIVVLGWTSAQSAPPLVDETVIDDLMAAASNMNPERKVVSAALDGGVQSGRMSIEKVWIDKCQKPGPGRTPADRCDRQPTFEKALVTAILENPSCAPAVSKRQTVSFALEVQHRLRRVRLFPGRSGSLPDSRARATIACVRDAMPEPVWNEIPHDHTRYIIGALVAYVPSEEGS